MKMQHLLLQPAPEPLDRGHLDGQQPRRVGWKRHDLHGKLSIREGRLGRIRSLRGARVLKLRMCPRPHLRLQFSEHVGVEVKWGIVLHNPQPFCREGSDHLSIKVGQLFSANARFLPIEKSPAFRVHCRKQASFSLTTGAARSSRLTARRRPFLFNCRMQLVGKLVEVQKPICWCGPRPVGPRSLTNSVNEGSLCLKLLVGTERVSLSSRVGKSQAVKHVPRSGIGLRSLLLPGGPST